LGGYGSAKNSQSAKNPPRILSKSFKNLQINQLLPLQDFLQLLAGQLSEEAFQEHQDRDVNRGEIDQLNRGIKGQVNIRVSCNQIGTQEEMLDFDQVKGKSTGNHGFYH